MSLSLSAGYTINIVTHPSVRSFVRSSVCPSVRQLACSQPARLPACLPACLACLACLVRLPACLPACFSTFTCIDRIPPDNVFGTWLRIRQIQERPRSGAARRCGRDPDQPPLPTIFAAWPKDICFYGKTNRVIGCFPPLERPLSSFLSILLYITPLC